MGGLSQSRYQRWGREARMLKKPHLVNLQELAADFLALRSAAALCKLLDTTIEDLLSVYTPEYETFGVIRRGKRRTVLSPDFKLAAVQRRLLKYLNAVYVAHFSEGNANANAFITATRPEAPSSLFSGQPPEGERNIVSNARPHVGKGLVVRIDIEDFFPSIKERHMRALFQEAPFSFPEELVCFLCQVILYQGSLPVGSPSSPILSNLILNELDHKFRVIPYMTYTRYADDFTFSTNHYSAVDVKPVVDDLIRAIEKQGFRVNRRKVAVASAAQRQEVTGVVVNSILNVRRTYIRDIRAILYSIEKNGWNEASEKFVEKHENQYIRSIKRYFYTAQEIKASDGVLRYFCFHGKEWFFYKSLRGRIEHVGYVKGKRDKVYTSLLSRLLQLTDELKISDDGNESAANKIAPELQDSVELAYITNATAKAIAYHAYAFLKHSGYTDSRIAELRSGLSINESIGMKGVLKTFQNESAYFLNLYSYMIEDNRFAAFANNLSNDKFKEIFRYNKDSDALNRSFDRRIFHNIRACGAALKDFDNGIRLEANTGLFFEGVDDSKTVYVIRRAFLQKLGMRACLLCESQL